MKKTLLTLTMAGVACGAMAQGFVTFGASGSTHPIEYTTDGVTITKAPVGSPSTIPGYGELNIAIYYANTGTTLALNQSAMPNLSTWTVMATATLHNITAIPGNVSGTSINLAQATGGSPVDFEVVGWTGTATSFTAAEAAGTGLLGWSGSTKSGGAFGWQQNTGTSTSPAVMTAGTAGFNTLVLAPVPEPGTIALGGLGAAALLLFRRRK